MGVKIKGNANIQHDLISCYGVIEILHRSDKVVYATWKLFDSSNNLLASISRNYFIGDKAYSEEEILDKIIEHILNYRMGRQKVFSNISIV